MPAGMDAEPPTWSQLNAEHGQVGVLRSHVRRQNRQRTQEQRRDRWHVRRYGCGYEQHRARQEALYIRRVKAAERQIAEVAEWLKQSRRVREMQERGYVNILRAWHHLAVAPGGVVSRRAHADFTAMATRSSVD